MKIIVIYADSGAGHRTAAESISRAAARVHPDQELKLIDALDYSTPLFRWIYPRTYLTLVSHFPPVWGFFYHLTDLGSFYPLVKKMRRVINYFNSKGLVKYLRREKPDLIISTHFYSSEVVAALKREEKQFRLISVVTDFRLHRFWVTEPADIFVGGSEETRADLLKAGVAAGKIKILGIPISPAFSLKEKRKKLTEKLNLRKDLPTVLLVSGGFAVGPIARLVKRLGNLTVPAGDNQPDRQLQVLVVCGRRERLYRRISRRVTRFKNPVRIYRFVNNMHELMVVADLLIGKAGGLTVAEALAKNLPMLVISPIPGQERRNCQMLLQWGVAVRVAAIEDTARMVKRILSSPGRLRAFRTNTRKLSRPEAAVEIVKEAVKLVRSS